MPVCRTLIILLLLAGCSSKQGSLRLPGAEDSAPARQLDPNTIRDAVPRFEPKSRRGNPGSYVVFGKRYYVRASSRDYVERGIASWYGTKFHGRSTSSGEPYDMYAMTAAHKSLPIPTYVQVTNLKNGRQTVVRVNDRGPFHESRIIDLSYAAATKLGIIGQGTGLVEVRAIDPHRPATLVKARNPTPEPVVSANQPGNLDLYIQVGSFSARQNADRLTEKISRQLRKTVRIQTTVVAGQPYFRVQVGPLASVQVVDQLTQALIQLGIEQSRVVID